MAMNLRRHPSTTELGHWLEAGAPTRVGDHVASCERCMTAAEEASHLGHALVADLHDVLAMPEDLAARTRAGLERRLRDEAALVGFFDLFSSAWLLAGVVFDSQEDFDA
jgi:hypothetical protein